MKKFNVLESQEFRGEFGVFDRNTGFEWATHEDRNEVIKICNLLNDVHNASYEDGYQQGVVDTNDK